MAGQYCKCKLDLKKAGYPVMTSEGNIGDKGSLAKRE